MSETKVMSLRLSQELADELDAVARVEDVSVSAAIPGNPLSRPHPAPRPTGALPP